MRLTHITKGSEFELHLDRGMHPKERFSPILPQLRPLVSPIASLCYFPLQRTIAAYS